MLLDRDGTRWAGAGHSEAQSPPSTAPADCTQLFAWHGHGSVVSAHVRSLLIEGQRSAGRAGSVSDRCAPGFSVVAGRCSLFLPTVESASRELRTVLAAQTQHR